MEERLGLGVEIPPALNWFIFQRFQLSRRLLVADVSSRSFVISSETRQVRGSLDSLAQLVNLGRVASVFAQQRAVRVAVEKD